MLSTISWSQYIFILALSILIYYLFIWIICFRADCPGSGRFINPFYPITDKGNNMAEPRAMGEPDIQPRQIMETLRPLIRRGAPKSEMLFAIRQKLTPYRSIDDEGFRGFIDQYIIDGFYQICSIRLSEEDLRVLWK